MSRSPQLGRTAMSVGSEMVMVRISRGAYVDGNWIESPDQDREVHAAPRPVSPSDRKLLPEGMRTMDALTVLTNEPLKVASNLSNGSTGGDRIFYEGVWWRVVGEKPWTRNGFRRYLAVLSEPGERARQGERGRP